MTRVARLGAGWAAVVALFAVGCLPAAGSGAPGAVRAATPAPAAASSSGVASSGVVSSGMGSSGVGTPVVVASAGMGSSGVGTPVVAAASGVTRPVATAEAASEATSTPAATSGVTTPVATADAASAPAAPVATIWVPPPRSKTAGCTSQGGLPDPACTPGAVDPRVSPATLATTICARGYARTVRPPVNVTDKIKREQFAAYGLQGQRLAEYELDHLISLELGGAPADVANLWPEPRTGDANAHMKDAVENSLHDQVCRGALPLAEAQRQIATDWLSVYRTNRLTPAP